MFHFPSVVMRDVTLVLQQNLECVLLVHRLLATHIYVVVIKYIYIFNIFKGIATYVQILCILILWRKFVKLRMVAMFEIFYLKQCLIRNV